MDALDQIGINFWNLVAQIVAFILFIFLFWRFALKPILRTLDGRTERIRESFAAAEQMRKELQATEARNEQLLAEARQEAQQIAANARQASEATLARAHEEAGRQADEYLMRAQESLRQETNQARQQLRQELADLAVTAAGKIVRRNLDPAAQSALIQETLTEAGQPAGTSD